MPANNKRRPDRIAIDAGGFGWQVFEDYDEIGDMWSKVPQNPFNEPNFGLDVTWYVPEEKLPVVLREKEPMTAEERRKLKVRWETPKWRRPLLKLVWRAEAFCVRR